MKGIRRSVERLKKERKGSVGRLEKSYCGRELR